MLEDRADDGRGVPHLEKGGDMSPQYMQDTLGQWICYSFLSPYFLCGISRDKAEALARWAADLKWVTRA
jgi:hypothetical protein